MNWAPLGGPGYLIPGGIQIEARCPLSRNMTEWYLEERGLGEGLRVLVSPPCDAWAITQNAFSFVLYWGYQTSMGGKESLLCCRVSES